MSTTHRESTSWYNLDLSETRIGFVARHTLGPKVRGEFAAIGGGGRLDTEHPERSSLWLEIGAGSIRTGNKRRDARLRASFLRVGDHPTITFTARRVVTERDAGRVTGDLTVRGVTTSVTVDFRRTFADTGDGGHSGAGKSRVGIIGTAVVSRRELGVRWDSIWDAAVGDEVVLDVKATAVAVSGV